MSEKEIDIKINIGAEYDGSGIERANEDIKKIRGAFIDVTAPAQVQPLPSGEVKRTEEDIERKREEEVSYDGRASRAAEMEADGATRKQIIRETGIDPIWQALEKARGEQVRVNEALVEEYKREMEHYFTVAREDLERRKISGEIGKEDYEYGKKKVALEEQLYRVKLAEVVAEIEYAEAKYDSLQKQIKAEKTSEEKDEKAARIASEKERTANSELIFARRRVKREEERQVEAEASAAALRDAKKKAREEKERVEERNREEKKAGQSGEKQEEENRLQGVAYMDLMHGYKKAKKRAKNARKAGDEEGAEAADAEAEEYRAEWKRRKRQEKIQKMRGKVERKLEADKAAERQERGSQGKGSKAKLTAVQLMDDVQLRRNYTIAKRRYRNARKRRDQGGMASARFTAGEYATEIRRRKENRMPRRRRRTQEKRVKAPTVIAGKEKEIITEAMGYVERMERGEKENGLGIERLLKLFEEAQKTRSKRDDQLIAGIMKLVQAENIHGTKVERALEMMKRRTSALADRMFD